MVLGDGGVPYLQGQLGERRDRGASSCPTTSPSRSREPSLDVSHIYSRFSMCQVSSHPLMSRIGNIAVGFEERANIESLASPKVSVDGPV